MFKTRNILITLSMLLVVFAVVSAGEGGYTYYLRNSSGTTISTYNILGRTYNNLASLRAEFRTWSSHQSGEQTTISLLKARGRIWKAVQSVSGIICSQHNSVKVDCLSCNDSLEDAQEYGRTWWIYYPNNTNNFYAIGKHKILHPYTVSASTGNAPNPFYTEYNTSYTTTHEDKWRWKAPGGLNCNATILPDDSWDDD